MSRPELSIAHALVTGGRGFIGTYLVDELLSNGVEVTSIDVKPVNAALHPMRHEIVGDVRDKELMRGIFEKTDFDCVFDLASYTEVGLSVEAYRCNVEQTRAMVEYTAKFSIPKYVFYSTQFVFRRPGRLPASEVDYEPADAYGQSKVASERHIRAHLPREKWLILRPTYIWGAGLERFRDGLLYRLARRQLLISSDPTVRRYYGYVETIAKQTIILAKSDTTNGKVFYLSDDALPLDRFCGYFVKAMGCGATLKVPSTVIRLLGGMGSAMSRIGMLAPINAMQAREITTDFPIPLQPTLSATGKATDYDSAAQKCVAWALKNERFRAAIASAAI